MRLDVSLLSKETKRIKYQRISLGQHFLNCIPWRIGALKSMCRNNLGKIRFVIK
jgi:hypothetical protein